MEREIRTIVADNLKDLMEPRNLSANRLAALAGLSYTSVYDILTGKSKNPRIDTLQKIAGKLGVPLTDLFEGSNSRQIRSTLLAAFEGLGESDQQRLADTAVAWLAMQDQRRS